MALWRVDTCDVSHRYVEAETKDDAAAKVIAAITDALDIRVSAADRTLAAAYAKAGPIQRRNLLTALDGLSSPLARGRGRRARRQLERLQEFEEKEARWMRDHLAHAPPVAPNVIDRLLRVQERDHIDRAILRLHQALTDQPGHDGP